MTLIIDIELSVRLLYVLVKPRIALIVVYNQLSTTV